VRRLSLPHRGFLPSVRRKIYLGFLSTCMHCIIDYGMFNFACAISILCQHEVLLSQMRTDLPVLNRQEYVHKGSRVSCQIIPAIPHIVSHGNKLLGGSRSIHVLTEPLASIAIPTVNPVRGLTRNSMPSSGLQYFSTSVLTAQRRHGRRLVNLTPKLGLPMPGTSLRRRDSSLMIKNSSNRAIATHTVQMEKPRMPKSLYIRSCACTDTPFPQSGRHTRNHDPKKKTEVRTKASYG
jgi:hypothetical protein